MHGNSPLLRLALLVLITLAPLGCTAVKPVAGTPSPHRFDPQRYYAGKTVSRGEITILGGVKRTFTTQATGVMRGDRLLLQQQFVFSDGKHQVRKWDIQHREGDQEEYVGTAKPDGVGTAIGDVRGATFHWKYALAMTPGKPSSKLDFEQWMTLQADRRTMLNRGVIRKWGVRIGELSETFTKVR